VPAVAVTSASFDNFCALVRRESEREKIKGIEWKSLFAEASKCDEIFYDIRARFSNEDNFKAAAAVAAFVS
jgi:hypothetical protein